MSPRPAAAAELGWEGASPGSEGASGASRQAAGSAADGCCEIRKRKAQALRDHRPSCFHGVFFLNIYQYLLSSRESLYLWIGQRKEFHFLGGLDSSCQHRRVRRGQRLGAPATRQARWGWMLWPKTGPAERLHPGYRSQGSPGPAVRAQRLLSSISSGKLMHFLM